MSEQHKKMEIPYNNNLDLTNKGRFHMPQKRIMEPTTFRVSPLHTPQTGSKLVVRMIGDDLTEPAFQGMVKHGQSEPYDKKMDAVNLVEFTYDGHDTFYRIFSPIQKAYEITIDQTLTDTTIAYDKSSLLSIAPELNVEVVYKITDLVITGEITPAMINNLPNAQHVHVDKVYNTQIVDNGTKMYLIYEDMRDLTLSRRQYLAYYTLETPYDLNTLVFESRPFSADFGNGDRYVSTDWSPDGMRMVFALDTDDSSTSTTTVYDMGAVWEFAEPYNVDTWDPDGNGMADTATIRNLSRDFKYCETPVMVDDDTSFNLTVNSSTGEIEETHAGATISQYNIVTTGTTQTVPTVPPQTPSMYFDGTSYINTDYAPMLGTSDFTVEAQIYIPAELMPEAYNASPNGVSAMNIYSQRNSNGAEGFCFRVRTGMVLDCFFGGGLGQVVSDYNSTIHPSTWNHVAVSRHQGTLRMFLNGRKVAEQANWTHNVGGLLNAQIGTARNWPNHENFMGWIDNVVVTEGVGKYYSEDQFTWIQTELSSIYWGDKGNKSIVTTSLEISVFDHTRTTPYTYLGDRDKVRTEYRMYKHDRRIKSANFNSDGSQIAWVVSDLKSNGGCVQIAELSEAWNIRTMGAISTLNTTDILDTFWFEGMSWSDDKSHAFISGYDTTNGEQNPLVYVFSQGYTDEGGTRYTLT